MTKTAPKATREATPEIPATAVAGFLNALPDWEEVSRASRLALPIAGHEYVIPAPSYSTSVALMTDGTDAWGDEEFLERMLGDELARMRSDDVPRAAITHAAIVAHIDARHGRAAAQWAWQNFMDPDALNAAISAATKTPATKRAKKPAGKPTGRH